MNPVGFLLTAIAALVAVAASRRWAALALMAAVCYVTQAQGFIVLGFHFTSVRIVLLAIFVRNLARGELRTITLNGIDKALLAYAAAYSVMGVVGGTATVVFQFGYAYNVLLSYFAFRSLITSREELMEILPALAILMTPLALCMAVESLTGKNVFSAMGGQGWEGKLREGRYRCMGSFRGPHTAGTLGATLLPLFVALFYTRQKRSFAVVGLVAATVITYTSNSSGPLMAYLSSLLALAFWRLRERMRTVRWGIVAALVGYGLLSKAPIWYLFSKISDLTGGDGWHRSYLMEQCFNHFSDWWLAGTTKTGDWAAAQMSWGGADLTNQYVSCAAGAGLASLVLFILILVLSFRHIGAARRLARVSAPQDEMLLWCLGAMLFSHVVTQFSVTYFDQFHVVWWGGLALISTATASLRNFPLATGNHLTEINELPPGLAPIVDLPNSETP